MPAPRSFRRRHNSKARRQQSEYRVAQRLDAARCSLILPTGKRCPRAAVRHGYCVPCWTGEEPPTAP
jgi:hypothetical protein